MVPVYDKKNPDRLLGFIPAPSSGPYCQTYAFPMMSTKLFSYGGEEFFSPYLKRVTLEVISRRESELLDDGWKRIDTTTHVLATNAPLEDLRCLRGWRFPSVHGN